MVSLNYETRELSCKIVYYGPGLCGKTTNLQVIHQRVPKNNRSDMISLATESDRTLFFDFLPLDLGSIKGYRTKFQLYTVPGQVYYNETRKMVLRGADGVIFVADSQVNKKQENVESLQNLAINLKEQGVNIDDVALVFQYNKRDLPNIMTVDEIHQDLNRRNAPAFEAAAVQGKGVFEALKAIGKMVIDKYNYNFSGATSGQGYKKKTPVPDITEASKQTVNTTEAPPKPPVSTRPKPVAQPTITPASDDDIDEEIMMYIKKKKGGSTPPIPPKRPSLQPASSDISIPSEKESVKATLPVTSPEETNIAAPEPVTNSQHASFEQNELDPGTIELATDDDDSVEWTPSATGKSDPNTIDPEDMLDISSNNIQNNQNEFDPGAIQLEMTEESTPIKDSPIESSPKEESSLFMPSPAETDTNSTNDIPNSFFMSGDNEPGEVLEEEAPDELFTNSTTDPISGADHQFLESSKNAQPSISSNSVDGMTLDEGDDDGFLDIQPFSGMDEEDDSNNDTDKRFQDTLDDDEDDLDFNPYGSLPDDKS